MVMTMQHHMAHRTPMASARAIPYRLSMPKRSALVIDDDWDTAKLIENVLQDAGFSTYICVRGEDAIEQAHRARYDLVTMDIRLGGMDGYETIRSLRSFCDAYIVMITSLVDEKSIVQGYSAGADDFVPKPFHPHEFRAHVDAYLRRADPDVGYDVSGSTDSRRDSGTQFGLPDNLPESSIDEYGQSWMMLNGLAVNTLSRETLVDGEELALTKTEFDLLVMLLQSGRRVRSKASLVLELHAGKRFVTNRVVTAAERRSLEMHMANLRRKLGDNPSSPRWIATVHGVGYRLLGLPSFGLEERQ